MAFKSESTLFEPKFFIPDNQDPIFAGYGYNLHVIFIYVWGGGGLAMSKVFRKTQMTNKYTILLLHSTKHAGVQLKVNKIITPRKITWEFCIFEEGGPPTPLQN